MMQRRHKWYGLDHDSSWPKSTLESSSCCLLTFIFQPRRPISEFILTVSWPCGITWHQPAAHVFFPVEATAGHQKLIDDWCCQDIGTGVRGKSAWLLQQSIIWCQRGPPATFAECKECDPKDTKLFRSDAYTSWFLSEWTYADVRDSFKWCYPLYTISSMLNTSNWNHAAPQSTSLWMRTILAPILFEI